MNRVRINPKWLPNCTMVELQQINRLRLKGDSMMYEDVILCPHQEDRKRIRVFLAKEEDTKKIVAWSCLLLPPTTSGRTLYAVPYGTKNSPIYTYVNKQYRGKSIGRRLLKRAATHAIQDGYKPTVFFWNETSSAFFCDVQSEVESLEVYDISEWYRVYKRI